MLGAAVTNNTENKKIKAESKHAKYSGYVPLSALLVLFILVAPVLAEWSHYESSTIDKIHGKVSYGYVFHLNSGNSYQVDEYVYEYIYVYYADVTVMQDGTDYRLYIEGANHVFLCDKL